MWDRFLVIFQVLAIGAVVASKRLEARFDVPLFISPPWLKVLASIGVGVSVLLLVGGVKKLGRSARIQPKPDTQATLQMHGVYQWSRHPMYSGMILGAFSLSLYWGSYYALASSFILIVSLWLKAKREEFYLRKKFGHEYSEYEKRVGRFTPFV